MKPLGNKKNTSILYLNVGTKCYTSVVPPKLIKLIILFSTLNAGHTAFPTTTSEGCLKVVIYLFNLSLSAMATFSVDNYLISFPSHYIYLFSVTYHYSTPIFCVKKKFPNEYFSLFSITIPLAHSEQEIKFITDYCRHNRRISICDLYKKLPLTKIMPEVLPSFIAYMSDK